MRLNDRMYAIPMPCTPFCSTQIFMKDKPGQRITYVPPECHILKLLNKVYFNTGHHRIRHLSDTGPSQRAIMALTQIPGWNFIGL